MIEGTANRLQKPVRQAQFISKGMEMDLFQEKILGDDDPEKLLHTVYILLGNFFALRSREEHVNLRLGQSHEFKLLEWEQNKVVYQETFRKNYQDGMRDSKVKPKMGKIYAIGA